MAGGLDSGILTLKGALFGAAFGAVLLGGIGVLQPRNFNPKYSDKTRAIGKVIDGTMFGFLGAMLGCIAGSVLVHVNFTNLTALSNYRFGFCSILVGYGTYRISHHVTQPIMEDDARRFSIALGVASGSVAYLAK